LLPFAFHKSFFCRNIRQPADHAVQKFAPLGAIFELSKKKQQILKKIFKFRPKNLDKYFVSVKSLK